MIIKYTLPAHFASLLVNADQSGLTEEEMQEFADFTVREDIEDDTDLKLIDFEQEPYFARKNDMNNIGGDVLDFVYIPQGDIAFACDAKASFNAILSPYGMKIDVELFPLKVMLLKVDTNREIWAIEDENSLVVVFSALVDVLLCSQEIFSTEEGVVYIAQQTDAWYSRSDRTFFGVFTSKELAVLSAMKFTEEILVEDSGGYKPIREERSFGVFISECPIDRVEEI